MRRTLWILLITTLTMGCGDDDEPTPPTAPDTPGQADAPDTPDVPDAAVEPDIPAPPPPPFTQPGEGDHAGIAVVDITPVITETFEDLNGDFEFDGCRFDPKAEDEGCDEPFDDADGDGEFDAVFIGGFGPLRPALQIHDPLEVRALVLARGDEYVALVSLDLVGLGVDRTNAAREKLAEKGWDPQRVIIVSTHNHAGPDVRGLWGNPEPGAIWSGSNPTYNAGVVDAVVQAVEMAADGLEPVQVRVGAVHMRDRSEWFNGRHFGGKSPTDKLHGLINDIRDPIVVSDQVFVLQARHADGPTVATLVSWSGHPEVTGEKHNTLSADYVHYLRTRLEKLAGGRAMFLPECLGGMQSALDGAIPRVDEDGAWEWTTDAAGDPIPAIIDENSQAFARAVGTHVADAAVAALEAGEDASLEPFAVDMETMHVPIENGAYQLLFALGLFDSDPNLGVKDPTLCPAWPEDDPLHPGCVPNQTWRVRLGPVELMTAPGELMPELFWGLPTDDPRWEEESTDTSARGSAGERDSAFFPQHPPACDAIVFDDCRNELDLGDCDCRKLHDWPYRISGDPAHGPLVDMLEAKYRFAISNAGDHLGYIVPDSDFNTRVSFLSDFSDGDHYEETVSASRDFARQLWLAQERIAQRR